jgi:hypothetical protein
MRTGFSMKAFAVAALTFALAAVGCGGGAGGGGADRGAPATGQEALAHADAVNVTYYYLPG